MNFYLYIVNRLGKFCFIKHHRSSFSSSVEFKYDAHVRNHIFIYLLGDTLLPPPRGRRAPTPRKETRRKERVRRVKRKGMGDERRVMHKGKLIDLLFRLGFVFFKTDI